MDDGLTPSSRHVLALGGAARLVAREHGARILEADKSWSKERLPLVQERVRNRLKQLATRLGDAEWLDGAFSAGDLMMVSVLLRLKPSGIPNEFPNLAAYLARGEARPAYKRAFDAQLAAYNASQRPAD